MKRAIFLDRDGTLNPDPGYISSPEQFELYPGVAAALADLQHAGYLLILVSNQSGISRGLISLEQLNAVHEKLQQQLALQGAHLNAIYYCPHHPDFPYEGITVCDCRKPRPQLIIDAIHRFELDAHASYMIGDRASDVKAALAALVQPIVIGEKPLAGFENVPTFSSLSRASIAILGNKVEQWKSIT